MRHKKILYDILKRVNKHLKRREKRHEDEDVHIGHGILNKNDPQWKIENNSQAKSFTPIMAKNESACSVTNGGSLSKLQTLSNIKFGKKKKPKFE